MSERLRGAPSSAVQPRVGLREDMCHAVCLHLIHSFPL